MSKEERAVTLAVLTFFMFALSIFLTDGSFIFPFPLNEFAILLVSFLFVLWHPKKGVLPYLFLISAIAGMLSSRFFWEIFFSFQKLETFLNYTVIDWAKLTSGAFLLAAMLLFVLKYREWYFKVLAIVFSGLFVYAFIFHRIDLYCIAFLGFVILGVLRSVHKPFHLLWVLYFVLFGLEWLTPKIA